MPLGLNKECLALKKKSNLVVGVDEAGRGPIAGPVCCGAFAFIHQDVIDISEWPYSAIADSKQLAEDDREAIYNEMIHIAKTGHPLNRHKPATDTSADTSSCVEDECGDDMAAAAAESETSTPITDKENAPQDENNKSINEFRKPSSVESTAEGSSVGVVGDDSISKRALDEITFSSKCPFAFAMCKSEPTEIDSLNILNATLLSMARAVYKLIAALPPEFSNLKVKVLVDGNRMPPHMSTKPKLTPAPTGISMAEWTEALSRLEDIEAETIIKGDSSVFSIAAASIVAKVSRDRILRDLAIKYPQYDLEVHKGYPTPSHKALVKSIGPSEIHRLSFEPCYSLLKTKVFPVPPGRDFRSIQELKEAKKVRGKRSSATLEASQPKLKLVKRAT